MSQLIALAFNGVEPIGSLFLVSKRPLNNTAPTDHGHVFLLALARYPVEQPIIRLRHLVQVTLSLPAHGRHLVGVLLSLQHGS